MKTFLMLAFFTLTSSYCSTTYAATFDFAQIGNAGNAGYADSFVKSGAVPYHYAISKTGVTNAQYTEFLNAVAATDTYGLYNSEMGSDTRGGITRSNDSGNYSYAVKADAGSYTYANKPVVYVSWYDSVRFANWLHNGQGLAGTPSGDTETGAYTLEGGAATPSNGLSVTRNVDAAYWLASEHEWFKAAFHDLSAGTAGTYFKYATGTDIDPDNNLPTADTGNSANYFDGAFTTSDPAYPNTDVDAYSLSASSYGTYDQNGNVFEWNETLVSSSLRGIRGGSAEADEEHMALSGRYGNNPMEESYEIGFRVATIPEPSSLLLLVSAVGGMLMWRRK